MSAALHQTSSPTKAKNIQIRRVVLNDASQMPSDLSSTPGGTLFSTTPGGTRLVYDRAFLLECRNSPLANSPPVGLPQIPGVTCTVSPSQMPKNGVNAVKHHGHVHAQHQHVHVPVTTASAPTHAAPQPKKPQPAGHADEPLFEMDI